MGLAQELGGVKNHFGILTTDARGFVPQNLCRISPYSVTDLSEQLGKNRANMYDEKISFKSISKDLMIAINKIVVVSDLAFELFNDEEKTIAWMVTPNRFLFGLNPFEACLAGKGDELIQLLFEKIGPKK